MAPSVEAGGPGSPSWCGGPPSWVQDVLGERPNSRVSERRGRHVARAVTLPRLPAFMECPAVALDDQPSVDDQVDSPDADRPPDRHRAQDADPAAAKGVRLTGQACGVAAGACPGPIAARRTAAVDLLENLRDLQQSLVLHVDLQQQVGAALQSQQQVRVVARSVIRSPSGIT